MALIPLFERFSFGSGDQAALDARSAPGIQVVDDGAELEFWGIANDGTQQKIGGNSTPEFYKNAQSLRDAGPPQKNIVAQVISVDGGRFKHIEDVTVLTANEELIYVDTGTQYCGMFISDGTTNGGWMRDFNGGTQFASPTFWCGSLPHDRAVATGAVQAAFDCAVKNVIFTEDYTVNTVTLTGIKRIVDFNGYQLKGGDNTGLDAVFEFTGLYCVIKQIDVSCEYRDYKCAMRWHSLSSAAGSSNNTIYGMFFRSCIIGLVFGNFQGELSIDAPQSENVIYDFKTRACKIAFVGNQLNGFVTMVAPVLDCYFHEWSALAAFDAAAQEEWNLNCMVFDNPECRLNIVGGELLKTASQTGVGMRGRGFCISGGTTFEVGCVQVEFTGEATIANQLGGFQGGPAGSPMFKISAGASAGAIKIHDADFRRTAGAVLGIGGTHTAIEFGDNTSDVFFSIDGCEFGEWLPRQFRLDDRIKITNTSFTDSTQTKYRYINSDTLNELPQYGVDHRCQTLTGWFENFGYGNAGNYTIGADGPAGYPALSIQMATTGRSDTSFVDLTSAASIMATAIRVTPTEIWEFQGHIKSTHAAANRSRVEINYFDDSGVSVSDVVIAVPTAVSTWEKFIASEEIPAGVFFIGVRFRAEIATFNYADISVNKISVVTPVT